MKQFLAISLFCLILSTKVVGTPEEPGPPVQLVLSTGAHPRLYYGAEQLAKALTATGYVVKLRSGNSIPKKNAIVITHHGDPLFGDLPGTKTPGNAGKEGFEITSAQANIFINGSDQSGALYGCLELAEIIKAKKELPASISIRDSPRMVLRGTCIGLQKTNYLPGRTVYEYPYTPESFPWFYDKDLWIRYLDSLVANRYNSLYLWNGHPFASLVKLPDYPYAVEVDEKTFEKNEEIFRFLSQEADRRGIWVIQMFYNVILSKPFAERHGLKTQDRAVQVTPLMADYTRKSIAAFVQKYPNVGLLVTLGEALEGEEQEVEWFTKTIIGGVKDGLKAINRTDQPPIVLRGHDTNPQKVMKAALPLYKNLYTENKYNGEALTTYEPRGSWAQMHRELSELGSVHIDNVHILANLEPFRYGATDFIRKSVVAMKKIHGANGLHLYPESSYWEWPYSADKANQRLLQIERDWIWYRAWGRYAWNPERDLAVEEKYWSQLLSVQFGSSTDAGKSILNALEESGEIAPKLLRRFGITNGNRQTLTLGMTMGQLVNPHKYRVWPELYSSDGPEGEMLIEFAAREWGKEKHIGETPLQIIREVVEHAEKSVKSIDHASAFVTRNTAEFNRLKNDIYCYRDLARHFNEKVLAANLVLRYKYSKDASDLRNAVSHLEKSVEIYRELAHRTQNSYLYANSMQTGQRKIPVGGDGGRNKTWVEILPVFERELLNFRQNLDSLSQAGSTVAITGNQKLENQGVTFLTKDIESYTVSGGVGLFKDAAVTIKECSPGLEGLRGIKFSKSQQLTSGTMIMFKTNKPVQVVVGYFSEKNQEYVQPSNLETDASANDHGQAEVKISNALNVDGMPAVNVHSFSFQPGTHTLSFGKGLVLILGFVGENQQVGSVEGLKKNTPTPEVDWLFE